ncbi:MAG TPA: hypothetical protein DHW78_06360 [Ruminococcaceae bacterium]|nr:hypothetical protein [Oscillospiraceae bacterium]HCC01547.1 hypothetical protein [Oscillospiraceae bacterium]HCM23925.1 hypothetical protein [Oscillospiraceae bacterium]
MQNRNFNQSSGNRPIHIPQDPQHITPEQVQQLLNQLSPADRKRVNNVLQDKTAVQKLLSTPQAQALMKKLGGGN